MMWDGKYTWDIQALNKKISEKWWATIWKPHFSHRNVLFFFLSRWIYFSIGCWFQSDIHGSVFKPISLQSISMTDGFDSCCVKDWALLVSVCYRKGFSDWDKSGGMRALGSVAIIYSFYGSVIVRVNICPRRKQWLAADCYTYGHIYKCMTSNPWIIFMPPQQWQLWPGGIMFFGLTVHLVHLALVSTVSREISSI